MALENYVQFLLLVGLWAALTPTLGRYIARVMTGETTWLHHVLGWVERVLYRVARIHPGQSSDWRGYALDLVAFNAVGVVAVFALQLLQGYLPLNPQKLGGVGWASALNTAVSFVTNTNWQSYTPETTMSYLTQMLALSVQNFVSAAVGLCVVVALARGIANRSVSKGGEAKVVTLGNFWVDLVRGSLYVLLPLSTVIAVFLLASGVIQNFKPYLELIGLEGLIQHIPFGPVASQVAIKMLGTNGGGFFSANSAHPFENPSGLTNFMQVLAVLSIPAALTFTFGSITKARRHGWVLFATMLILFVGLTALALHFEYGSNVVLGENAIMEGKETRFGIFQSTFFAMMTTASSCGAVNAMHASLSPLAGGLALLNMMLGEIVFGGVGAGLYGMVLFVLLTVFVAGLMVGRSPEYLGKRIESREMTMVILAILSPGLAILVGTGISVVLPGALSSLANKGPHGFSEILYAFTSAAANNGSSFAGLNANTNYFNIALSVTMLIGRFAVIIPTLAVAGSLAGKKFAPPSSGTFEVDGPLFAVLLIGIILIVGALTFVPALALGPIVEHLLMLRGQAF